MTTPKSNPRKPLDPYTLRWCARHLRAEARGIETPGKSSTLNAIASWYRQEADEFEREARAARNRT